MLSDTAEKAAIGLDLEIGLSFVNTNDCQDTLVVGNLRFYRNGIKRYCYPYIHIYLKQY